MSDVERIREALAEVYTPEGIDIWLASRNRNLMGWTPIELISEGRTDIVLAEAEALAGGGMG